MRLRDLSHRRDDDLQRIEAELAGDDGEGRALTFEISGVEVDLSPDRGDAAAIGALLPAMEAGEAPVSRRLAAGLVEAVEIIGRNTSLPRIDIAFEGGFAPTDATISDGVATGLSGGVDSFQLIRRHLIDQRPPTPRITHLLFTDSDAGLTPEQADLGFGRGAKIAEALGTPLLRVTTNLGDRIRRDHLGSHTVKNVAAAHCLRPLAGHFIYGTGYD